MSMFSAFNINASGMTAQRYRILLTELPIVGRLLPLLRKVHRHLSAECWGMLPQDIPAAV